MNQRPIYIAAFVAAFACSATAVAQEEPEQPAEPASSEPPAEEEPTAEPPAPEPTAQEVSESRAVETPSAQDGAYEPPMFSVGAHIGLLVPQLFGELGSWPVFGLELGYILPFDVGTMKSPLQVSFDVLYSQPGAKGTEPAPAIGEDGADFDWKLVEQILVLELSGLWRFMPPGEGFSAYATAGPRMYLMKSVMEASSGDWDFGTNRETKTQFGLMLGGGAEYAIGPGSVFGALEFGWSDLNQRITGDSNTGAFVLDVGYRLMF